MDTTTSPTPTPGPSNEDLVAYLDGELAPERRAEIEHLMATDETVRMEVQRLQNTWDLLDELPSAQVDERFTQTTVEMVVATAQDELAEQQLTRRRWNAVGGKWLGVPVAGLLGYALALLLIPNHNEVLVRNLPVIENLESYRAVGSLEVLSALEKSGHFSGSDSGSSDGSSSPEPNPAGSSAARTPGEEARLLESLPPAEQAELQRKFEIFDSLDDAQQQALVRFHRELKAAPDRAEKQVVLGNFFLWYKDLNAVQRAELNNLQSQPDALIAQVNELVEEQRRMPFGLTGSDAQIFIRWMEERNRRRLSPEQLETLKQADNPDSRRRLMMQMVTESWRKGEKPGNYSEEEIAELAAQLSPPARARLERESDLSEKRKVIGRWLGLMFRFKSRFTPRHDGGFSSDHDHDRGPGSNRGGPDRSPDRGGSDRGPGSSGPGRGFGRPGSGPGGPGSNPNSGEGFGNRPGFRSPQFRPGDDKPADPPPEQF